MALQKIEWMCCWAAFPHWEGETIASAFYVQSYRKHNMGRKHCRQHFFFFCAQWMRLPKLNRFQKSPQWWKAVFKNVLTNQVASLGCGWVKLNMFQWKDEPFWWVCVWGRYDGTLYILVDIVHNYCLLLFSSLFNNLSPSHLSSPNNVNPSLLRFPFCSSPHFSDSASIQSVWPPLPVSQEEPAYRSFSESPESSALRFSRTRRFRSTTTEGHWNSVVLWRSSDSSRINRTPRGENKTGAVAITGLMEDRRVCVVL